jgi:hypothetical protein
MYVWSGSLCGKQPAVAQGAPQTGDQCLLRMVVTQPGGQVLPGKYVSYWMPARTRARRLRQYCACAALRQACVGCQCVWHRVFDGQARGRVQAGCGWLLPSLAGRCSQESMCGILDARAGACQTLTPVLCVCRGWGAGLCRLSVRLASRV